MHDLKHKQHLPRFITPSRDEGFVNAEDRNRQSMIDNMRKPRTFLEICKRTGLGKAEVMFYLKNFNKEGCLEYENRKYQYVGDQDL